MSSDHIATANLKIIPQLLRTSRNLHPTPRTITMRNPVAGKFCCFLNLRGLRKLCSLSSPTLSDIHSLSIRTSHKQPSLCVIPNILKTISICPKPIPTFASFTPCHSLHSTSSVGEETHQESITDGSNGEVEPIDSWEEEDEAEPEVGDGGDGGGIVLENCSWGGRALSIAQEVLLQSCEGMEIYAFKTSPRGYIYVRLDKLMNEYGCPSMEEIESFSREYKKKLDEVGAKGEIPDDLALEVSSPGADRLLRVPDDLLRFKDMPMVVCYSENLNSRCSEKNGVYFLDSIETESNSCVWKLADVKENRDPSAKGRPLSRKQKDYRLKLPYDVIKRVTLYISY